MKRERQSLWGRRRLGFCGWRAWLIPQRFGVSAAPYQPAILRARASGFILGSFVAMLVAASAPMLALQAAPTVIQVSAKEIQTLFVKSDGSLWLAGAFNYYQHSNIPQEIESSNVIASAAGNLSIDSLYLKSNHSLWGIGNTQVIISNDVTAIAEGASFYIFIKADGSLSGMGLNSNGQLGPGLMGNHTNPIVSTNVTAIAAGFFFSLFLKSDGSLWGMGDNSQGQLGDGSTTDKAIPEQITTNVTTIAAGAAHSLFLKSDGSLWGVGQNGNGELGDGSFLKKTTPERISTNVIAMAGGYTDTLFVKTNGSLWGMGWNNYGELGDGTITQRNVPVQIVPSNVVAVAAGQYYAHFIKADGSLWGMGRNDYGQLGDGSYTDRHTPVRIYPPVPFCGGAQLAGTNLVLNCINGQASQTVYTFSSPTLTLPVAQWTPVATNVLSADGNFTLTNALSAQPQFYRLAVP